MATTTRQATKTITMPPAAEESVPERVTQRKQADSGRFRLQVDRQTKASYATYEAAETAGLGIKKEHRIAVTCVATIASTERRALTPAARDGFRLQARRTRWVSGCR